MDNFDNFVPQDPINLKEYLEEYKIPLWKEIYSKFVGLFTRKKKLKLVNITPVGLVTFAADGAHQDPVDQDVISLVMKPKSELIDVYPTHTVEDICELISQHASDHDFLRIIAYPLESEFKEQILKALYSESGKLKYPLYEYELAEIISSGKEELKTKSLIFKYKDINNGRKPI
jgi:hypothetical protein